MDAWQPVIFFQDENPEAVRQSYVEYSAKYGDNYSPLEICRHVFKGLRDPEMRAMQAAQEWPKDLDLQERIRQLKLNGNADIAADKNSLIRKAIQIADNSKVDARERLAAIKLAAELQGYIVKPVEMKIGNTGENNTKPFGGFRFIVDPNAGKPPEPDEGEGE